MWAAIIAGSNPSLEVAGHHASQEITATEEKEEKRNKQVIVESVPITLLLALLLRCDQNSDGGEERQGNGECAQDRPSRDFDLLVYAEVFGLNNRRGGRVTVLISFSFLVTLRQLFLRVKKKK